MGLLKRGPDFSRLVRGRVFIGRDRRVRGHAGLWVPRSPGKSRPARRALGVAGATVVRLDSARSDSYRRDDGSLATPDPSSQCHAGRGSPARSAFWQYLAVSGSGCGLPATDRLRRPDWRRRDRDRRSGRVRAQEGVPFNFWLSIGNILQWKLSLAIPGRPIRTTILARSGETLERQHRELANLSRRPDILIIYCGHNEFSVATGGLARARPLL